MTINCMNKEINEKLGAFYSQRQLPEITLYQGRKIPKEEICKAIGAVESEVSGFAFSSRIGSLGLDFYGNYKYSDAAKVMLEQSEKLRKDIEKEFEIILTYKAKREAKRIASDELNARNLCVRGLRSTIAFPPVIDVLVDMYYGYLDMFRDCWLEFVTRKERSALEKLLVNESKAFYNYVLENNKGESK